MGKNLLKLMRNRHAWLAILLPIMLLTGACNSKEADTPPAQAAARPQPVRVDWQRINATIDQFTYPKSTLLFAPREQASSEEQSAQEKYKVNINRLNKRYAIFKTSETLEK